MATFEVLTDTMWDAKLEDAYLMITVSGTIGIFHRSNIKQSMLQTDIDLIEEYAMRPSGKYPMTHRQFRSFMNLCDTQLMSAPRSLSDYPYEMIMKATKNHRVSNKASGAYKEFYLLPAITAHRIMRVFDMWNIGIHDDENGAKMVVAPNGVVYSFLNIECEFCTLTISRLGAYLDDTDNTHYGLILIGTENEHGFYQNGKYNGFRFIDKYRHVVMKIKSVGYALLSDLS